MDLVKGDEQTQIVRLILASQEMARPFAAPPGIPEDRKRALIEAFDKTMKDPDFLAEAEKMKAEVSPVSAASIESLVNEVYKTPKDIVAKAKKAIAP
jgi:tripartite-type tricarboxylate transporter receptor subunit TctC